MWTASAYIRTIDRIYGTMVEPFGTRVIERQPASDRLITRRDGRIPYSYDTHAARRVHWRMPDDQMPTDDDADYRGASRGARARSPIGTRARRRSTRWSPSSPSSMRITISSARSQDPIHYRLEDLQQDIAGGHDVIGTVYVEAYESGWRKTGPEALRPVGEVEMIAGLTRTPLQTPRGPCQVAAGIVSYADLTLGDGVADVLEQQLKAGAGALARRAASHGDRRRNGRTLHQGPPAAAPHGRPRVPARLRATRSIRPQLRCLDLPHAVARAHRPRGRIPGHDHRAGPRRRAASASRSGGRSAPKSSRSGSETCARWPPGRTYA